MRNIPPINLSRSFARLLGLEVKGRGPFYVVEIDDETGNSTIAYDLSARGVADYLERYDVAQLQASGRCCPVQRKETLH